MVSLNLGYNPRGAQKKGPKSSTYMFNRVSSAVMTIFGHLIGRALESNIVRLDLGLTP